MSDLIPHHESPVMNTKEAAAYVRRTPNAMKILRHRRKGPDSFEKDGRIYYYRSALDRWLAEGAASDSRSNRDLDPTEQTPQPRRRRKAAAPKPTASHAVKSAA